MLVVQGITTDGARFRPSTWADMLVGRYTCSPKIAHSYESISPQEAQTCVRISKYIHLCCSNKDGNCEIRINQALADEFPSIYEHIRRFAISNDLQYTETQGGDLNEE